MTDQSFEYKTLHFLNERFEIYSIADHVLKTALYDIPENEYDQGMTSLRGKGYIKNKDEYEQGLTITTQGKIRLQQMQKEVDYEKIQYSSLHTKSQQVDALKNPLLWTIVGGAFLLGFYFGNNKFDRNLIELSETKRTLLDTIQSRDNLIRYIRSNSDSALNIIAHMPYQEMNLDTNSWRKVQTTIENAGAALSLNK